MRKFENIKLMNFENNILAQIKHGAYTECDRRATVCLFISHIVPNSINCLANMYKNINFNKDVKTKISAIQIN